MSEAGAAMRNKIPWTGLVNLEALLPSTEEEILEKILEKIFIVWWCENY